MLKISDRLRAATVKRWHIVNVTRQQSVAEHQFSVSALAGEMAKRLNWPDEDIRKTICVAMTHDQPELISGDMPTPTKVKAKAKGFDIDSLFSKYEEKEPESLRKGTYHIIKCADHLEGVLFLRDHKCGDHAEQVYMLILEKAVNFFRESGEVGIITQKMMEEIFTAEYII